MFVGGSIATKCLEHRFLKEQLPGQIGVPAVFAGVQGV